MINEIGKYLLSRIANINQATWYSLDRTASKDGYAGKINLLSEIKYLISAGLVEAIPGDSAALPRYQLTEAGMAELERHKPAQTSGTIDSTSQDGLAPPSSIDINAPMKMVFSLQKDLLEKPHLIQKAQALTLDKSKPYMGLKGTYGLFGSKKWWESIASERMPLLRLTGCIERAYAAGQNSTIVNTLNIRLADGNLESVGIYINDPSDLSLFKVGRAVTITYALDPTKQSDGEIDFAKIALEMSISIE